MLSLDRWSKETVEDPPMDGPPLLPIQANKRGRPRREGSSTVIPDVIIFPIYTQSILVVEVQINFGCQHLKISILRAKASESGFYRSLEWLFVYVVLHLDIKNYRKKMLSLDRWSKETVEDPPMDGPPLLPIQADKRERPRREGSSTVIPNVIIFSIYAQTS